MIMTKQLELNNKQLKLVQDIESDWTNSHLIDYIKFNNCDEIEFTFSLPRENNSIKFIDYAFRKAKEIYGKYSYELSKIHFNIIR